MSNRGDFFIVDDQRQEIIEAIIRNLSFLPLKEACYEAGTAGISKSEFNDVRKILFPRWPHNRYLTRNTSRGRILNMKYQAKICKERLKESDDRIKRVRNSLREASRVVPPDQFSYLTVPTSLIVLKNV